MSGEFIIGDKKLNSRLLLGTAQYPSLSIMREAIINSGCEIITVSIRRQQPERQQGKVFWDYIKDLGCHILPNTAGCRTVKEAVTTAQMAREIFKTNWIKLEVIGNDYTLQPDPFGLVEAASILNQDGFTVLPYCTDDLVLCERLLSVGCKILMPWAAPIGSGLGIINPYALTTLRNEFNNNTIIIDAGLGKPSQACEAMEMGFDGVLLNTAVAKAIQPIKMAESFKNSIIAGREGYLAGLMPERNFAIPSTPEMGKAFVYD